MAKDIVIHVWCDRHMETDERVEGREFPITLDGKPRTVDLCEACIKEFFTPLADLLDTHGVPAPPMAPVRRAGAPTGGVRGARCVWCPLDFSATSGSGYMSHIKTMHGYASAVEAFGTTCPICGKPDLRMMMSHINKAHPDLGFTHTSQAIMWAAEHGDPAKVYAATLRRKPSLNPETRRPR